MPEAEAWEIGESFLTKDWFVIDAEVLDISNRWRLQRGGLPLTLRHMVASGQEGLAPATVSDAAAMQSVPPAEIMGAPYGEA
ncbi:hypothetical protein JCM11641_007290 [Rhodosporidiobolus odoratus]